MATAHDHGIGVVLDIISNHTGDVFAYDPDRYEERREDGTTFFDPRWHGRTYRVAGFRDEAGAASLPLGPIDLAARPAAHPDGALWPRELPDPSAFTRKGRISNWISIRSSWRAIPSI